MKIAFTLDSLLCWQGGADFAQKILAALVVAAQPDDRIDVVVTRTRDSIGWRAGRIIKRLLTGQWTFDGVRAELGHVSKPRIVRSFVGREIPIRFYRRSHAPGLKKFAIEYDAVGPTMLPLDAAWRSRWLGYIPDVQHRRLPHFFSSHEIETRDASFQNLLDKSKVIFTNAPSVREDLNEHFKVNGCEIVVLPFAACPEPHWFSERDDVERIYNIRTPYFICSNQFWKHKNHKVIFEAINLAKQGRNIPHFVFTGATDDYRHPTYFSELQRYIAMARIEEHVQILGIVPKSHQIQLIRKAIALVQPTLFEGGPGGGSVYDAVALGQRTIVSDIPVNRMIAPEITAFFDPYSVEDLLRALREVATLRPNSISSDLLLARGLERRRACGAVLRDAFALAAI